MLSARTRLGIRAHVIAFRKRGNAITCATCFSCWQPDHHNVQQNMCSQDALWHRLHSQPSGYLPHFQGVESSPKFIVPVCHDFTGSAVCYYPKDNALHCSLYCQEFRVRRSMKIFDLDEDILSIVVSYLSISEARELSATARGFHALARQRALSELVLASPTDLTKAHAFMLLDIPNRLRWLRDLRVDIDERFILHHTNHLADLLENAHALQNIHVTSSETWVWSEPRIGDALLHLENLRRIGFSQVGQRVLKVVSSMRSCPVQVDLHGPSGWYRSPVMPTKDSQPADFASLMRSIMPHQRINSLDLSLSHLPLVVRLLDAALQWSTVVHLTISVSFKNAPLPDELVRCFPNLRTLRVHGPEIAVSSPGQRQHFWPKLDYVHGSPIAIGYWNTSCPVYHLSLYTLFAVPAPCSRPHLAAIRDSRAHDAVEGTISVIQQVSPVVLTLNSSLACDFMGLDDHHWTTMLQSAPRLRLLAIDLRRLSGEQFLRWKVCHRSS